MSEKHTYTDNDLEHWVEKTLISPSQLTNIRAHVAANGTVADQDETRVEQRSGLNFVSIAYYFGGFMILLAYTIFVGVEWESLGAMGQIAISAFTIAALWLIGTFLQRKQFTNAGGLLIFAGTGIVPLLIYTVQRALGLWQESAYEYEDFYHVITTSWVPLELISIVVAVFVVWRTRFPLIALLIAFWTWFLSMDIGRLITRPDNWSYSDQEQAISVFFGIGMLLVGYYLQRTARKDYSFWFYLFGHILLLCNLTPLTLDREGILGLVFFVIYLAFVIASIYLQRKVFLVFGALGCYGYLCYLAFDVFEGALGFSVALSIIGLLIVLSAVGYQKYAEPWLKARLTQV